MRVPRPDALPAPRFSLPSGESAPLAAGASRGYAAFSGEGLSFLTLFLLLAFGGDDSSGVNGSPVGVTASSMAGAGGATVGVCSLDAASCRACLLRIAACTTAVASS